MTTFLQYIPLAWNVCDDVFAIVVQVVSELMGRVEARGRWFVREDIDIHGCIQRMTMVVLGDGDCKLEGKSLSCNDLCAVSRSLDATGAQDGDGFVRELAFNDYGFGSSSSYERNEC